MTGPTLSRRQFAQFIVAGGVGLMFVDGAPATIDRPLTTQWWLELHADGRIRMLTKKIEMGQGAHTGLRTVLAEELDVVPAYIEIVQVPSDPVYGEIMTGGSFTLAGWHERMQRAGAVARHMLIQAAAARWAVSAADVTTSEGHLMHLASGRKAAYGEFVAAAAALTPPADESVRLKPPSSWRYIGKPGPIAYHDAIISGAARYGIDIRLPNMCHAVLARSPVLGGRLLRFDDSESRRTPGFIKAVALRGNAWPNFNHCRDAVAVVAESSWAAQRAREALRVDWDPGPNAELDTGSIFRALEQQAVRPGVVSFQQGDVGGADAPGRYAAVYRQPYLAHAPLEPPNATAQFVNGRIEVWCGNQRQTRLKDAIVLALGVKPENVTVYATLIGGSFGRRLEIDYGVEAAKLATTLDRPVQVLWTREDDLRYGLFRPGSVHHLAARLDAAGHLASFEHRYAAESVLRQQEPGQISETHGDASFAAPLISLLYDVPNVRLEHNHAVEPMVPCAWWRGTFANNVTTVVECFMDELAERSGQDPLAFRLAHLRGRKRELVVHKDLNVPFDPKRMRRVLEAVAHASGWLQPASTGCVRGLACGIYDSPECHAAVVAEMTLRDGALVLLAATVAVDVGVVVNPEIVKSQCIGGFVMGASAALREGITWKNGRVEQRGFEDYPPMRMSECPPIEVVIVPSEAGICGVGEIVTPAAIAAVSNAASRLLRGRVRSWPILSAPSGAHRGT